MDGDGEEVGFAQPPHAESDKKIVGENVKNWQLSTLSNGFYCTILMGPRRKVVRCQKSGSVGAFVAGCRWSFGLWIWVLELGCTIGCFSFEPSSCLQAACALWLVCWWCEMLSIFSKAVPVLTLRWMLAAGWMDDQTKEQQYNR